MDKKANSKDVTVEVTRESLIAISGSMPDKTRASKLLSELESGKLVEPDRNEAEEYRSELMAISDSQSVGIKGLPVAMEN